MRHLVDLIPLPRALAEAVLIVGMFLAAYVVSIIVLSGVQHADTIAGGAFLAIVLGFAVQRVLWDVLAGLFMFFENWFEVGDLVSIEPWGLQRVVERLSRIVPVGPTQFIRTPQVVETEQLDDELYRITATAEVAPGREWLAEDLLPKLARERSDGLIVHGPVVTLIDEQAVSRFARAVWFGRGRREPSQPLARIRAMERRLRGSRR